MTNKERCAAWYEKNRAAVSEKRKRDRATNPHVNRDECRRRYKKNPEKYKAAVRKSRGIPEPTRPMPDRCECCRTERGRGPLNIDHDHTTGRFRGWICSACNLGIGKLGDTIDGALNAVSYLARS